MMSVRVRSVDGRLWMRDRIMSLYARLRCMRWWAVMRQVRCCKAAMCCKRAQSDGANGSLSQPVLSWKVSRCRRRSVVRPNVANDSCREASVSVRRLVNWDSTVAVVAVVGEVA